MKNEISKLYKTGKTVFSTDDLASYFESDFKAIRRMISYYASTGVLRRVHKWIYVLGGESYDAMEMANKIMRPSYISLDTVLRREWVIFQYSEEITVVTYKTVSMCIDGKNLRFHFMKREIRENFEGVEYRDNISIASKERAFLDAIYLYKDFHFDNLSSIDWDKCFRISKIYGSKTLEKRLFHYHENYAQ